MSRAWCAWCMNFHEESHHDECRDNIQAGLRADGSGNVALRAGHRLRQLTRLSVRLHARIWEKL